MNTTEQNPTAAEPRPETEHDAALWNQIRARYEKGEEMIRDIAADVGMTQLGLSLKAKAMGWVLRARKKAKRKVKAVKAAANTRGTILRLKDLVENRLSILERELSAVKDETAVLQKSSDITDINTLARTLEKVLELENAERTRKRKSSADFKHLDDAERDALAQKLERLETERKLDVAV